MRSIQQFYKAMDAERKLHCLFQLSKGAHKSNILRSNKVGYMFIILTYLYALSSMN